jgi:hypothetical protein
MSTGEAQLSQETAVEHQELHQELNVDQDDEELEEISVIGGSKALKHSKKLKLTIKKGKRKGNEEMHFQCNYCTIPPFVGERMGRICEIKLCSIFRFLQAKNNH